MRMRTAVALCSSVLIASTATVGCSSGPEASAVQAMAEAASVRDGDAVNGPAVRRVWPGDDALYASSISPDGRYFSMIDWSSGNLAVRDLNTGEMHRLTDVRNGEDELWQHAGGSVFSPDGRKIVVAWHHGPDLQLRVIEFDPDQPGDAAAADARVIFDNPEFYPYSPFDWSPDGSQVIAKVYPRPPNATSNQLALISTSDGTYRALRSFDWREPLHAEFSPDGRFVAYDLPGDPDSPDDRDVFVLSVDGTYEARLAADPAFDRLLGWHPDGSILFHSDRGDTHGVWRLPMADGRPTGPPELVKADTWGIEPRGFAGHRFYYSVEVEGPRLYTAAVDVVDGRLTSTPIVIEAPARLEIIGWEWSADGLLFAYSATRPGVMGSIIGIRSAAGEELQTIRLDLHASSRIRWHPDGRSLVVFARDANGRRGFHRIDLETASSRAILNTDGLDEPTWRGNFELSPDGGTLYFATAPSFGEPASLVAYDVDRGTSRVLLAGATELYGNLAISPDGARLAFVAPAVDSGGNIVSTVPVAGGPVTALSELRTQLAYTWGLEWTLDGGSIVVTASNAVDWEREAWIVPAAGGEARRLDFNEAGGTHHFLVRRGSSPLRLHPDGRRIAFLAGKRRAEIWVMEGLGLPSVASKEGGDSR